MTERRHDVHDPMYEHLFTHEAYDRIHGDQDLMAILAGNERFGGRSQRFDLTQQTSRIELIST
jgi:hypothetical protein